MITIRRALPIAAALTVFAVSCGGSSDSTPDDAEAATTVEATEESDEVFSDTTETTEQVPVTDAVEPGTTVAASGGSEVPAPTDPVASRPAATEASAPAASAAASVEVSLIEWGIDAPTEYTAGEVTFTASNSGSFPHEFAVIAGEGYEALPLAEGGAIIEDDLPTGALLGRTGRLGGGSSDDLTVTLAPGNYVLVCNLGGGTNSHAGKGQRLDITVA